MSDNTEAAVAEQVTENVVPVDENPGQDTPQATAADAEGGQQEQAKTEPPKTFSQAEVDAIVERRLRKAERGFAQRQQRQAEQSALTRTAQAEVQRDDFATDEAFNDARIAQIAAKKAEELIAQREASQRAAQVQESFQAKAEAASEKYPDFDIVVSNPRLSINKDMAEFIAESDMGADVAYHLGKNPALAQRIAEMPTVKAVRELARIETELATKPKATPSKAPDPITPVGSRGRSTASALPSDDDDMETWMRKERDRQRAAGRIR